MQIDDLIGKRVAGLFSGGLDSTTIVNWLSRQGVEVVSLTVDLGQPDEKNMDDIVRRMRAAGAVEAYVLDGKKLLAEYMMQVIQGLGHHEGGYMNTTGIARMATVKLALEKMKELELDVLVHGATGRGNDQVRFELATAHLTGGVTVYAPWRDVKFKTVFGGRKEMIEYCQRMKLEISATLDKPYSTDANFCGLTHEAGKLESIEEAPDYVNFLMGAKVQRALDIEEIVTVEFSQGIPMAANGLFNGDLVEVFYSLNKIAGRNGVGIGIDVVENRFVCIKSRGLYESPAATLLEIMYKKLLQLIMDRERRKFFEGVSRQWADIIYEGKFYSPLAGDLWAVIANVARQVSGKLTYTLYKGNAIFVSAERVVCSLYDSDRSSMENVGEFDHLDAQGFLNVLTVTARAQRSAGQTRKI